MEEFFLLKLNRVIWISVLNQKKILESYSSLQEYIKSLDIYLKSNENNPEITQKVIDEINYSKNLYFKTLKTTGDNFFAEKDYDNAVICYNFIFHYAEDKFSCLENYFHCLNELNQNDLEMDLFEYFENSYGVPVSYYKVVAEIFQKMKEYKKAIKYLEQYIEKNSETVDAYDYNLLGCYYNNYCTEVVRDKEILQKSVDNFKKAYDIMPCHLFAKNVTIVASKLNRPDIQKFYWDEILNKYPMNNDDKYDYAAFCWRTKNFEGLYKYFDARFDKENNKTEFPEIKGNRYDGTQDISNKVLLIHCEQGFGDTFWIYGYMSRLKKLVKKIIFVVQTETLELFKNLDTDMDIYSRDAVDLDSLEFDYYIPSMSIPIALKLNETNIAVGGGYITAQEDIKQEFKDKYFNNDKIKIGFCCAGNAAGNKTRDIPVAELLPLDKMENVELYSLNKSFNDKTFEIFENNKVNNIAKDFRNFEDTVAAIANLDLVVTTDNCILNLAGAMNKKTFAIFNYDYEFRWFDLTGDNVVYFDSVKPFVNSQIDDWQSSVSRICEEIKALK